MDEFRMILKELRMGQKDFADKLGIKYGSVRKGLCHGSEKGGGPLWSKAFVLGFRLGEKKNDPSGKSMEGGSGDER